MTSGRRVLVRVNTTERHLESNQVLAARLREAWSGSGIDLDDVGWVEPFQPGEEGASQYAVCWVKRDVWDVLVHGALWVSFSEQGLATPEVFGEADL